MTRLLNKIDSLFIFLILSLGSVFLFVNDSNYFFPSTNFGEFKNYENYKHVFEFPSQGLFSSNKTITNYNSSFNLYYSTNGGKSYNDYNGESLKNIKHSNITNKITSIRDKKPFGDLPQVTSILIKAKHKDLNIFTKPKQITYFSSQKNTLPIVNLVVNEDDLFDEYAGIMNLGAHSWVDNEFYKEFWYRNANYNQRGDNWLKTVYFQYFESNKLMYETKAKIQISGHASRSLAQKSMKIKSTDENGKLKYQFFGDEGQKKYTSLVLRNSGNDNTKTLFADLLMHNLISNTNVLSQKGKAVNVFLNGNYWGIYNLRERQNKYYIAKKEDVKQDEITVLEKGDGRLKSGDSNIQSDYIEFIDKLTNLEPNLESTYNYTDTIIDISSFIDYIIIETYYGNGDWLINNTLWYKAKSKKWKWLIVDLDNGLTFRGVNNINTNYFDFLFNSNSITANLFKILIKNPKFKTKFKARSVSMMDETFADKKIKLEYNLLKNELNDNIDIHLNRWRNSLTRESWEINSKNNLEFLLNRKVIFLEQVNNL